MAQTSAASGKAGIPPIVLLLALTVTAAGSISWLSVVSSDAVGNMLQYWPDIVYLGRQHLALAFISSLAAAAIGIPLGILLSRPGVERIAELVMQALNIGNSIPTLALLALAMVFLGIGIPSVVFALTLATLLPIVRNSYASLRAVPEAMKEAATGMGMTPSQVLIRVELPNAIDVIMAGVRTGVVINMGAVPLAFLIGGGGLGDLIFMGIDLNNMEMMMAGAIPTTLLALAVDGSLELLRRLLSFRSRSQREEPGAL